MLLCVEGHGTQGWGSPAFLRAQAGRDPQFNKRVHYLEWDTGEQGWEGIAKALARVDEGDIGSQVCWGLG